MSAQIQGTLKFNHENLEDINAQIQDQTLIVAKQKENQPMAEIHLKEILSIHESSDNSYAFDVQTKNQAYHFEFSNDEDLMNWLSFINQNINKSSTNEEKQSNNENNQKYPIIDDFEVLKVLGHGGFGKVQLVRYKKDGKIYAMKSIRKNHIIQEDLLQHTLTERQALLSLSHPFILSANYTFQTVDKVFYVSEFIPGGELRTRITVDSNFSIDRIRFYGAMLVSAIGFLHEKGIIHRDIKPQNILIDQDGYLRLIDLGLIKNGMLSNSTTSTFCGTSEYMAPEMIECAMGYNKDVDWWSLGIILYEMAFRVKPFLKLNKNELFQSILNDPVEFPADIEIDKDLKDLIKSLLQKLPEERIGAGIKDAAEIEEHPFFELIDFDKLENKEYSMEWKPEMKNELDVSEFSTKYTNQSIQQTPDSSSEQITSSAQILFKDFTSNNLQ